MADKTVKIPVVIETNDSKIKAIDEELQRLKMQQLQIKIDANKSDLEEIETKIQNLKTFLETANTGNVNFHIDDSDIIKAEKELETLESQSLNLQIAVADDELTKAKAKEEELNDTAKVDIEVNDTAVNTAMSNIQSGLNDVKAGFGEIATGMTDALESSGKQELNLAFLKNSIGDADIAKQKMQDINQIVQDMPGDDTALQGLLSSASAKNAKLTTTELQKMGTAATDYFTAMSYYGKSSIEAQQDMTNYILAGNTAELERSPILQGHIDKLKEANTIQERSKVLQEALNEEGWGGLSEDQDIYANKLATFEGMLERGKTQLGGFFQEGAKAGMDFLMNLDDLTGGISTMGLSFATEFGPGLFQGAQGLVSMGSGLTTMSKEFGGIMPMIQNFAGQIPLIGGALSGLSLGPVALVIAAIVALGVAIYEVGKAFGWWSDVGTMFDALKAGVMALWNAFTSNTYVVQIVDLIKQGLTDAWNAIVGFGQAIWTALSGGATGGFDILGFMINNLNMILNAVGPLILMAIQGIIQGFRNVYTAAQFAWPYVASAVSTAVGIASGVINAGRSVFMGLVSVWNTLSGAVQTMASTIQSALNAAGSAWNSFKSTVMNAVQPILDAANQVGDAVGGAFSAIGLGGIETPTVNTGGYNAGYTNVSQGNTIIFNMYGDVKDEKTIDDMIDAINNRVQYEALANGTATDSNGGMI